MFQSCLTFRVWRGIRLEIASRCCFENSISIPGMAVTGQLAAAVCLGMHCLDVVKQECRLTTYVACMACRSFSWICWHVHVISLYPASFRSSFAFLNVNLERDSERLCKFPKGSKGRTRAKVSPELPIALWEIQFVLPVFEVTHEARGEWLQIRWLEPSWALQAQGHKRHQKKLHQLSLQPPWPSKALCFEKRQTLSFSLLLQKPEVTNQPKMRPVDSCKNYARNLSESQKELLGACLLICLLISSFLLMEFWGQKLIYSGKILADEVGTSKTWCIAA